MAEKHGTKIQGFDTEVDFERSGDPVETRTTTGYSPEELEQLKAAYQSLNKTDQQTVKDILRSLADKTNESEGECISNARPS